MAVSLGAACSGLPDQCRGIDAGGPFCVPDSGVAAAGQKLSLEIVDQCNASCGTADLSCAATRDGGTISLSIVGTACTPVNAVCNAACALTKVKCEVPALEQGDYTIVSPGQSAQVLQVRDGGASASCSAVPF